LKINSYFFSNLVKALKTVPSLLINENVKPSQTITHTSLGNLIIQYNN